MTNQENNLIDIMNSQLSLQDLAKISNSEMEAMYNLAYTFYSQNNYSDASKIFKLLCIMNHNKSEYWQAIAGCQMMNKEYTDATNSYMMAIMNNPSNLILYIWCSDCAVKSENFNLAIEILKLAIESVESKDNEIRKIFENQIEKINKIISGE